jgi:hypothetical protein
VSPDFSHLVIAPHITAAHATIDARKMKLLLPLAVLLALGELPAIAPAAPALLAMSPAESGAMQLLLLRGLFLRRLQRRGRPAMPADMQQKKTYPRPTTSSPSPICDFSTPSAAPAGGAWASEVLEHLRAGDAALANAEYSKAVRWAQQPPRSGAGGGGERPPWLPSPPPTPAPGAAPDAGSVRDGRR